MHSIKVFLVAATALLVIGPARAKPAAPVASASVSPESVAPADEPAETAIAREVPDIDSNTCATCHSGLPELRLSSPAKQFATSVHSDDRIGCVACHKGDAKDPTVRAHDRELGFTPRPSHETIASICGGCHKNAPFIRRFNARLRTDQGELFPLSMHGKLSAAGDHNAPNCATCHGTHDIVSVTSLRAPTHPRNVAALCAQCHENRELMKPYGIATNQRTKWERSAHARALLGGNPLAPSCTGCHGPHSATPPRAITVGRVCGQCHPDQLEAFRKSPHSKAFRRLGLSECVPCHDPHEARRSSWIVDSSESVCNKCHAQDARPRQIAGELSQIVGTARGRLARARNRIVAVRAQGINIHGAQYSLEQVATEEQKLSITLHSLDPSRLRGPLSAVLEAADRSENLVVAAQRERQVRRRGYFVALGLAGLLFALLVAKAVQLARRRSRIGA